MAHVDKSWDHQQLRAASLDPGEAHVWYVDTDTAEWPVEDLAALLSQNETTRVDRFKFDHLKRRYTISHGVLRQLLSRYTDTAPNQLQFVHNQNDKPSLACGSVQFNISHSRHETLLAFTATQTIGVDLEIIRENVSCLDIARRFFSAAEVGVLTATPEAEQRSTFFRCWTRKEAYVKARGDGIAASASTFTVSLEPDRPSLIDGIDDDIDWTLTNLPEIESFKSALCVRGSVDRVRCFALLP